MIENLLYLILLILGFAAGIILSNLCKDEIKAWKKTLFIISGICLFIAILISFIGFEYKFPVIISLFFMIITCLTIVWKSY